jgi:hypothetical protein
MGKVSSDIGLTLKLVPVALLAGCAGKLQFQQGAQSPTQFAEDKAQCEHAAHSAIARAEAQAENAESESDEQVIGSGLGAMFVGADQGASTYNRCMRKKGYSQ